MRFSHAAREIPCECVYRAIFRSCFSGFREDDDPHIGTVSWEFSPMGGRRMYGRKREEYNADFCLVGGRVLTDADYEVFKLHFLLGADWRLCCRQLHMDRGSFYHAVYRIEERLGRVFAELEPYALYPVIEYFNGTWTRAQPLALAA
jgi:hypothetical protein